MNRQKKFLRITFATMALMFNMHFDYNISDGVSLGAVGTKAYAVVGESGGSSETATRYGLIICYTWYGASTGSACSAADPKGPCDKKTTC